VNCDAETDRIFSPIGRDAPAGHFAEIQTKYIFLYGLARRRRTLLKHRWGRKIMNIKIGDKIRYIATSEDGEVVGASELAPGYVLVRFGASFEYLIEKDRLSLIAGGLPRIPVIHR
jgi:hypothetical protein